MDETNQPKTPGPTNRQGLYAYASKFSQEAIDAMVEIMRTTRNESLKLGAAKALLDKSLPDLKVTEITGENGEPIKFNIITGSDYVSALGKLTTTPDTGSTYGPTEVQSTDMAQTGTQNDNSDKPVSEVVSA